jgi:hypothetical protein
MFGFVLYGLAYLALVALSSYLYGRFQFIREIGGSNYGSYMLWHGFGLLAWPLLLGLYLLLGMAVLITALFMALAEHMETHDRDPNPVNYFKNLGERHADRKMK